MEGDDHDAGAEYVEVVGGAGTMRLWDDVNPIDNPFNRTINTTDPPQTEVTAVDIDQFDISSILAPGDSQVDVTYSSGADKIWLVVNVTAIDQFVPVLHLSSSKSWPLTTQMVMVRSTLERWFVTSSSW